MAQMKKGKEEEEEEEAILVLCCQAQGQKLLLSFTVGWMISERAESQGGKMWEAEITMAALSRTNVLSFHSFCKSGSVSS